MKSNRINTRRKPVRKTVYARLFNKTKPKRQRAAAAAASSADEYEESGINISRSLTIIFAIHILAIGMIFIHKQYLSERTPSPSATVKVDEAPAVVAQPPRISVLKDGDQTMMPKKGDNFEIIAARYGVAESDLRNANPGVAVRPGAVLRIPQGRRIVAEQPPEVTAIQNHEAANQSDRGLVEIGYQAPSSRRPQVVRPLPDAPKAAVVSSGRTHVIKSGDNIWRISNQYGVSQQEVLSLNNISDPTKLKIGQVIKLP